MICTLAFAAVALQAPKIMLSPMPSGGVSAAGRLWMRCEVKLSAERPASLTKTPALSKPMYGTISLGRGTQQLDYIVVLDEPAGEKSHDAYKFEVQTRKLYVDFNRNCDLTDDKPPSSSISVLDDYRTNGQIFEWRIALPVALAGQTIEGVLNLEYFVPGHVWAQLAGKLNYSTDFGVKGTLALNGKTYDIALRDAGSAGSFAPYPERTAYLWIDRDGDGQMSMNYEGFPVDKPFNLEGVTYEIQNLEPSGKSFTLVRSKATVPEMPVPTGPIPTIGGQSPGFVAKSVAGKSIRFPSDYKGKLVLLDFWATWCGLCLAEAPNVVQAAKAHGKDGFVVVGVSLDDKRKPNEVLDVARKAGLNWDHAYDAQGWQSPIAKNYRVTMIPSAFLVDGDTGTILDMGDKLRGKDLEKTISEALAKRKG